MAAEIPIGTPSIVQHDMLGELAVDLKQVRERPIYVKEPEDMTFPREVPEIDVLRGEIRGTVQADGLAIPLGLYPVFATTDDLPSWVLGLYPVLTTTDDLPSWVDECATRIMSTIANLDAIKAHVAERRPDWSEPGDMPVSNVEFVGRLRLFQLGHYADSILATFNDGGLYGGHVFNVAINKDGKLEDEVGLDG